MTPELNPFDASRIAPGHRSFRFHSPIGKCDWWTRFAQAQWRGAIIGPHGSGKTTLIRELLRPLDWNAFEPQALGWTDEQTDRIRQLPLQARVFAITVSETHSGSQLVELLPTDSGFLRQPLAAKSSWRELASPNHWLILDGYERLSQWSRWRLNRVCLSRNVALTVTSHRVEKLPTLQQCQVSVELAQELIAQSLGVESPWSDLEIKSLLQQHQGNLREVFFVLFDRIRSQSS